MERTRPTTIERQYGWAKYEQGYEDGYKRCLWDLRRRKLTKEKRISDGFKEYIDFMEDEFAENRKR